MSKNSIERNALLFMAGQAPAPASAPATTQPAPGGAQSAPAASTADDSDVLDVHIKKGGSWWPFILGVSAGVAGSVFVYTKFMKKDDEHTSSA